MPVETKKELAAASKQKDLDHNLFLQRSHFFCNTRQEVVCSKSNYSGEYACLLPTFKSSSACRRQSQTFDLISVSHFLIDLSCLGSGGLPFDSTSPDPLQISSVRCHGVALPLLLVCCSEFLAYFVMTLSPLLFELQHPVRHLAARSTHDIHNRFELPRVILSVKSDGFTCTDELTCSCNIKACMHALQCTCDNLQVHSLMLLMRPFVSGSTSSPRKDCCHIRLGLECL